MSSYTFFVIGSVLNSECPKFWVTTLSSHDSLFLTVKKTLLLDVGKTETITKNYQCQKRQSSQAQSFGFLFGHKLFFFHFWLLHKGANFFLAWVHTISMHFTGGSVCVVRHCPQVTTVPTLPNPKLSSSLLTWQTSNCLRTDGTKLTCPVFTLLFILPVEPFAVFQWWLT